MTNSTDNQNYVRAVLAGIGIDFDETEILSVSLIARATKFRLHAVYQPVS